MIAKEMGQSGSRDLGDDSAKKDQGKIVPTGSIMRTKIYFILWFAFLATIGVVAIFAFASMTPVQSGPGALTALANIPNYILIVLCGILAMIGIRQRPIPLEPSRALIMGTVAGYSVLLIIFFSIPALRGCHKLQIRVIDWNNQPVSHVFVNISTNRSLSSLIGIFTPTLDVETQTDVNGFVSVNVSKHAEVLGYINPSRSKARLVNFRVSSFQISQQLRDGTFTVTLGWANKLFDDATNNHFHIMKNVKLDGSTLTVFLPAAKGEDYDPYTQLESKTDL